MDKKFEIINKNELPRKRKGISWESIEKGFIFKTNHYKYGYNEFELEDYKDRCLYLKCGINLLPKICTYSFLNGDIGRILGLKTSDFKAEIGQTFKDDKRDLTIIDRKYIDKKFTDKEGYECITKEKFYKYKCNKCGFECGEHYNLKEEKYKDEIWIREGSLLKGGGCSCCGKCPQIVVEGINDISTTTPWMLKWITEEDAKKYTYRSNKRVEVVCPNCKNKKTSSINNIYTHKSIGCICGDGISYPEKFMMSILIQLGVDFQPQLTKKTFSWCDKYRYDFYIPSLNMIIETHGEQHYRECSNFKMTLEEQQEIDRIKYELALANRIDKYIVINCRYSDLEWIKENIVNSELSNQFEINQIDWLKCEKSVLPNLIKEVCDYWNNKEDWETTVTIAKNNPWGIKSRETIAKYLKKGAKLGWCEYDAKEELKKSNARNNKSRAKRVEMFKNGVSLGVFESCWELERQSEKRFGIKLNAFQIRKVCIGEKKQYQNFEFKYINTNAK